LRLAVATVSLFALGAAACGELPNVTTAKDLRVLGVRCNPAGFLVDLDNPGGGKDSDWQATITALVVDPLGQGQELQITAAAGCPDYIDTITSATLQGTKLCPPESAASQIPEPIGHLLKTKTIITPDMPKSFGPLPLNMIQYEPWVTFGLTAEQVREFFTRRPEIPALDESIKKNRDFGIPGIVNLTFTLGDEQVEAIKNVVYWPVIQAGQVVNQNPIFGDPNDGSVPSLRLYSHRDDDTTGIPDMEYPDPHPTISLSAGNKLFVDPTHEFAAEEYLLNIYNADTKLTETRMEKELIRFYFYATAGTFEEPVTYSETNPITGALHTDSEYTPPKPEEVPAEGLTVTIWVVAHDERAGTEWTSTTITVMP